MSNPDKLAKFIDHWSKAEAADRAGFAFANGSLSSNQSGEGEIRRAIIEADTVDCMIALPGLHSFDSS